MKKIFIVSTFLLLTAHIHGQKTIFHEFESTASDFTVQRWNISKYKLPIQFIQESIDKSGRVVDLKFCENGEVLKDHLCYLETWIKFEYPNDTTIISYSFNSNGSKGGSFECENPYKVTYHLSKDQRLILSSNEEYYIDTLLYLNHGWTRETLGKELDSLLRNQTTSTFIDYYPKSFKKLNGIFPVSKEFGSNNYNADSPEGKEIEKALKIK